MDINNTKLFFLKEDCLKNLAKIKMKKKVFPVSMAFLWGIVFAQSMRSTVLGICMGLLMGIAFGLFDSEHGGDEDE